VEFQEIVVKPDFEAYQNLLPQLDVYDLRTKTLVKCRHSERIRHIGEFKYLLVKQVGMSCSTSEQNQYSSPA
jgi:hypothetical protein